MHFSTRIFGTLLLLASSSLSQKQIAPQPSGSSSPATDFTCPEDFGYFPHPSDCTQYYVCVFGGALLESCTGGLMYSHDLQTCDWPRNVYCYNGTVPVDNNIEQTQGQQERSAATTSLRTRGSASNNAAQSSSSATGGSGRGSYSYNPIKIETYGQLSRAAEESISGGKKRVVLPDDEYQQQRSGRSYEGSLPNYKEEIYQQGRSLLLLQDSPTTTNCLTNSSSSSAAAAAACALLLSSISADRNLISSSRRKKRSIYSTEDNNDDEGEHHHDAGLELYEGEEEDDGSPSPSHKLMRRDALRNMMNNNNNNNKRSNRSSPIGPSGPSSSSNSPRALFDQDFNSNSIQYFPPLNGNSKSSRPSSISSSNNNDKHNSNKKSASSSSKNGSGYSHRVSSPGNILYPPSYYQTPTYGLVNMDKLKNSISSSTSSTRIRPNSNHNIPFTSPATTGSGNIVVSTTSTESPIAASSVPSRVVKITTSKPPLGDNAQTGSYYSSQRLPNQHHQSILDYTSLNNFNPYDTSSLLVNKAKVIAQQHQKPQLYNYTPQQQQRWNHVVSNHNPPPSPTLPPGQPGYYNPPKINLSHDDKRIVLKTPGSPLLTSPPGVAGGVSLSSAAAAAASQSNNNNYEEKRLSDFVTNAYLNRLKGVVNGANNYNQQQQQPLTQTPQPILDYHAPPSHSPHQQQHQSHFTNNNLQHNNNNHHHHHHKNVKPHHHHHNNHHRPHHSHHSHSPYSVTPRPPLRHQSHHHNSNHHHHQHLNEIPSKNSLPTFIRFGQPQPHHHHQNHIQQIHQQVFPSGKGSVSRGKYTGSPNKYYDNAPVAVVPQQDDYAGTDDAYVNQRYAANIGNQSSAANTYFYSPVGATAAGATAAAAVDDEDASYYVYDDEEEEVPVQGQVQTQQKYPQTQTQTDFTDYKYNQQQAINPYTRVPAQPQQIITRRPTLAQAPINPTTQRTSTRSRTRTSSGSSSSGSSSSSSSTRSRPTLKPKSSIVKQASAPVRDVYLDPPSRPLNIYETPAVNTPASKCRKDLCVLPDCSCGGKEIPGGLSPQQTPQIVLLTFDDSVNDLNKNLYRDLFEKGRKNPNGCPISATFYISHEWTDYSQVQNLAADGHEIASHSVSHSFGEQYSQKKWDREINGQREILAAYGGVKMSEIRGMRAPFLAIGGNHMFKMLHDSNFTYDSSMPIYENRPPSWPYTLDYRIFHDCMIPPCPTKSYPGVWEVPMVMWQDLKGGRCSMGDACSNPPTAEGVYQMLAKNFERHYTTNRAPFGLYYHAAWFTQPHHKEGFEAFLDTLVQMDDVWLVTNHQALQWIRNPTPLNRILNFAPWSCHDLKDRPPRCNHPKVCNLWHKSGVRYMKTCQQCPQQYPWTGNTGVPYSNSI